MYSSCFTVVALLSVSSVCASLQTRSPAPSKVFGNARRGSLVSILSTGAASPDRRGQSRASVSKAYPTAQSRPRATARILCTASPPIARAGGRACSSVARQCAHSGDGRGPTGQSAAVLEYSRCTERPAFRPAEGVGTARGRVASRAVRCNKAVGAVV